MEKIVFKSGLTVVLDEKKDARSAAICFFVAAGNRYETAKISGVSHFIEHMVFKGTTTRSTNDIAEQSDIMGGQLNAYTAKEFTCYYSRALSEHVERTVDLICDMLVNPKFDKNDIETEKGVVLEEIGMYEDSPEEYCADLLNALCFKNKPLGFNILGTRKTVQSMNSDILREYMDYAYSPERIVVSLCGNFDRDAVLELLDRYFGNLRNKGNIITVENSAINGGFTLCKRPAEQTQIAVCYNGLPIGHRLKTASAFFSSIAGGAASSRINRRIREELGLAYSVYTFSSHYLETGMFGLSGGLAHKNQQQFLQEGLKILHECADSITNDEIERTREQFKAGVVLSNESMSAVASSMGKQMLLEGKFISLDELVAEIDNVTKEMIIESAKLVTDTKVTAVSVVGDAKEEDFYRAIIDSVKIS